MRIITLSILFAFTIAVLSTISTGCITSEDDSEDCACTAMFAFHIVYVVDATGNSITDATVTSQWADTGAVIDNSNCSDPVSNGYCIISDNQVKELSTTPRTITVNVSAPGYQTVEKLFEFKTDECQCHIAHVSGEQTIVLQSS